MDTLPFLAQIVFISPPTPVWSWSVRANAWRVELFQGMCLWARFLCCCSHHEGFPSPRQARQVGQRQKSKISWLFLEEEATKRASLNFCLKHKIHSWRFEFMGGETFNPSFLAQAPGQKVLWCSCKANMRILLTLARKKILLAHENGQRSTGNPYSSRTPAAFFWTGQRQPERICSPIISEKNLITLLTLDHIFSQCMSI